MKALISAAVNRPIGAIMILLAIFVLGAPIAYNLSLDFLPNISLPGLIVSTNYPGLPARECRKLITVPLENALSSLRGLSSVSSTTRDGLSVIELTLHWGTDMTIASVECREIIDAAFLTLPSKAKKPVVLPLAPNEGPLMILGVFSKDDNLSLVNRLTESEIKTRLQQLDGVGSVSLIGSCEEEVLAEIDADKMNARDLTLDRIGQIIFESNVNYPAGSIIDGRLEYAVKTRGEVGSVESLGGILAANQSGTSFKLSEIAGISIGLKDRESFFQYNGRMGVGLIIRRRGGGNPLAIAASVREEISLINEAYFKDLELAIVQDSSKTIASSLGNVVIAAILGAYAALIVLLVFTGSLAISGILVLSIPVSIALSIILFAVFRISINVMTLGGMALGIGMLVDNSVVVLDNLEQKCHYSRGNGHPDHNEIIKGVLEVAGAVTGSTLTSAIVFAPVLFLPGVIGALFKDMAVAVIFALFSSLLVCLTLTPLLFAKTKRKRKRRSKPLYIVCYKKIIANFLRKPYLLLPILVLIGAATYFFADKTTFVLFPKIDNDLIEISVEMPPGSSIDYVLETAKAINDTVFRLDNIDSCALFAGGESCDPYFLADPQNGKNVIGGIINLSNKRRSSVFKISDALSELVYLEGSRVEIKTPDELVSLLLGEDGEGTTFEIYGNSTDECSSNANSVTDYVKDLGLYASCDIYPDIQKTQVFLEPDREAIANAGLDLASIAEIVYGGINGNYVSSLSMDGEDLDVNVRLAGKRREGLDGLAGLKVPTAKGGLSALEDLARIVVDTEQSVLLRKNRKDLLYANISGTDKNIVIKKVKDAFPAISLSSDSVFKEYKNELVLCFAIALLLLYLVLGAQFQSFSLPLLLMASLPFGFFGIFGALFFAGRPFDLNAGLGFLALLGISINNSIVLYESVYSKIRYGLAVAPAVFSSAAERLRPILMTMLTTVTALMPLAFAPDKVSFQKGMAAAIIGGLFVSTLLGLLIMPFFLYRYFKRKNYRCAKPANQNR